MTNVGRGRTGRVLAVFLAFVGVGPHASFAEDWGAYSIIPASAPALVLEAVGSGRPRGPSSRSASPPGAANQKWVITPTGERPLFDQAVLQFDPRPGRGQGRRRRSGTPIVLEADEGQPWQQWALKKNEDGSYCLIPKHAPARGSTISAASRARAPGSTSGRTSPAISTCNGSIKPLAGTAWPPAGVETPAEHLRPARDQARSRAQGRDQGLHVLEQRDLPGHGPAGHGLHPGAIRRLASPPASMSRPTATTPSKSPCWKR